MRIIIAAVAQTVAIVQQNEQLRACHETFEKLEGFRSPS
jgi:hypothetical protein